MAAHKNPVLYAEASALQGRCGNWRPVGTFCSTGEQGFGFGVQGCVLKSCGISLQDIEKREGSSMRIMTTFLTDSCLKYVADFDISSSHHSSCCFCGQQHFAYFDPSCCHDATKTTLHGLIRPCRLQVGLTFGFQIRVVDQKQYRP